MIADCCCKSDYKVSKIPVEIVSNVKGLFEKRNILNVLFSSTPPSEKSGPDVCQQHQQHQPPGHEVSLSGSPVSHVSRMYIGTTRLRISTSEGGREIEDRGMGGE